MRRILFVTPEIFETDKANVGGTGAYFWNAANILTPAADVMILTTQGPKLNFPAQGRIQVSTFYPYKIDTGKLFWRSIGVLERTLGVSILLIIETLINSYRVRKTIDALHRENSIDLIQFTSLGLYFLLSPSNIPYVVRLSSITSLYNRFGKGYYGFQNHRVNSIIFLERIMLLRGSNIFAPSAAMIKSVKLRKWKNTAVIMSPFVDSGVETVHLPERPYVLYFGSIDYRKGCDLLLSMEQELFDHGLETVFAGKFQGEAADDLAIRSKLEKLTEQKSNVHFYGTLTKKEINFLIENACLVALPSRVDNLPNTLIESICRGAIVIGPDNWGFEQLIRHGENGFLFRSGDLTSFRQQILEAVRLSAESKKILRQKAKETSELLSPKIISGQLLDYYNRTIALYHSKSEFN